MRFGWCAAAAASVLFAGQASAATFVEYEADGTGSVITTSTQGVYREISMSGDLFFRFVVEVDPGYSTPPVVVATGSSFEGLGSSEKVNANIQSGTLMVGESPIYSEYGSYLTSTINLLGSNAQTFSAIPGLSAASGNISFSNASPSGGGPRIEGTINKLVTLGTVSGFQSPVVGVVPEPATWLMMILGTAAAGLVLRRRRARDQGYVSGIGARAFA